ncbi:UNVERIFIED_CONTAM: hypothetical protein K2H54_048490 [Gekko kuhli]
MALYRASNYTFPYEGPMAVLSTEARLYVGVMVTSGDISRFVLRLDSCYATPTQNTTGSLKYFIIQNSVAQEVRVGEVLLLSQVIFCIWDQLSREVLKKLLELAHLMSINWNKVHGGKLLHINKWEPGILMEEESIDAGYCSRRGSSRGIGQQLLQPSRDGPSSGSAGRWLLSRSKAMAGMLCHCGHAWSNNLRCWSKSYMLLQLDLEQQSVSFALAAEPTAPLLQSGPEQQLASSTMVAGFGQLLVGLLGCTAAIRPSMAFLAVPTT